MLQTVFRKLSKSGLKPMIITKFTRNYEPTVIKDVYKLYQHNMKKYEDDEKCDILKFVNSAESAEKLEVCIPKAKAGKLFKHKTQNGPFKLIEQFLDVKGIQVKHIEKFADKILKGPGSLEESKAKQPEAATAYQPARRLKDASDWWPPCRSCTKHPAMLPGPLFRYL